MGWAVGDDLERNRHIGYGVPAICDHPGCGYSIDRGLSYRCGDIHDTHGCGLYFCGDHLYYMYTEEGDDHPEHTGNYCTRCCGIDEGDPSTWVPPYEPTPDTLQWAMHVLHDESWAQFREEEPERVKKYKEIVDNA